MLIAEQIDMLKQHCSSCFCLFCAHTHHETAHSHYESLESVVAMLHRGSGWMSRQQIPLLTRDGS